MQIHGFRLVHQLPHAISVSKQKFCGAEIITGLKSGLKATENIHIAFISRYGFPRLNATYTTTTLI